MEWKTTLTTSWAWERDTCSNCHARLDIQKGGESFAITHYVPDMPERHSGIVLDEGVQYMFTRIYCPQCKENNYVKRTKLP